MLRCLPISVTFPHTRYKSLRILVTGVTGQIGSALLRSLGAYDLLPADRAILDLTKPGEIASRLTELRPEVIINSAAYTAVDRAEDDRELAFTVNGESPGAIARWAADHQTPLIHLSTDYVFDGSGTRPWREDDPTGPLNVYGASKLAGEKAIFKAGGSHLIVRTSWIYSAQGTNFLCTISRLAREREEIRVISDQIGAPTSAEWVAETISQILKQGSADLAQVFDRARRSVNVASAGKISWHGFAQAIVNGLRRRDVPVRTQFVTPIEATAYPSKAMRPKNSCLDLSRLSEMFQIEPMEWNILLERELDRLVPILKNQN